MAAWIWVLIPLVAIIGGFIIEYQKNKISMMNRSRQNEEEVEDLRKLVNALKGRIENLEAIAAGEPEEFSTGSGRGMEEIEIEEEPSIKEQNQQEVSNMADKRRTK
ncbi:hypothetical protein [Fodinibius saliphilus]|uniref:hypothetical protein n=1 Tax=Fodinibius saliphilus TaxID=1920650 RepID=UPI0011083173|nr:hypothetical protein [Fodinibius saliphilus]